MRVVLTMIVVLGVSAAAQAQTIGLPLPSIGLPLPQIGLPLPPTGLPPVQKTTLSPGPKPREGVNPPRSGNPRRARDRARTVVYYVPAYGWDFLDEPVPGPPPPQVAPTPPPPTGYLIVDLQTDVDPQVLVDGAYLGLLSALGGEVELEPGVHHLELRADDYEPRIVDVQILADRATRYRTSLDSAARDGGSRPALLPPATIYMIPGCYVGNLPPQQVALPSGCDPARASVFPSER